ncbi:MAG: carboxypeptidase-like regulatory domain-containing protein [bacterium]|nr:carboxypeptidase-like regulatory domain-containing protein [bacterium]
MKKVWIWFTLFFTLSIVGTSSADCTRFTTVFFLNGILADKNQENAILSRSVIQDEVTKRLTDLGIPLACVTFANIFNKSDSFREDVIQSIIAHEGGHPTFLGGLYLYAFGLPDLFSEGFQKSLNKWNANERGEKQTQLDALRSAIHGTSLPAGTAGPVLPQEVIIVGHSQGNLFANELYDALTQEEKQHVRLVAVASPASDLADHGTEHVTLDEDAAAKLFDALPGPNFDGNVSFGKLSLSTCDGKFLCNDSLNASLTAGPAFALSLTMTCNGDILCHDFLKAYMGNPNSRDMITDQIFDLIHRPIVLVNVPADTGAPIMPTPPVIPTPSVTPIIPTPPVTPAPLTPTSPVTATPPVTTVPPVTPAPIPEPTPVPPKPPVIPVTPTPPVSPIPPVTPITPPPIVQPASQVIGHVRTPDNRDAIGVHVTLTERSTHNVYRATTGSDGSFRFINIPSGQYLLHAETTGFHADHGELITVTSAGVAFNTTLTLLKNGSFHFELERLHVEGNIAEFTSDFKGPTQLFCGTPVTLRNGRLILTDTDGHGVFPQEDSSLVFGDACSLEGQDYGLRTFRGDATIVATFVAAEPATNTNYHLSLLTRTTHEQVFLLVVNEGAGTILRFYTVGPNFHSFRMLEVAPLDLSHASLLHLMLEYDDVHRTVSAGYRIDGEDDDPFVILDAHTPVFWAKGNEAGVGIGGDALVPSD